jgi:hypothetical protein
VVVTAKLLACVLHTFFRIRMGAETWADKIIWNDLDIAGKII